jgi:hypothetical protein
MRQLGGRHYLDRLETEPPRPDWLSLQHWRKRLDI